MQKPIRPIKKYVAFIFVLIFALFACLACSQVDPDKDVEYVRFQAHRGVSSDAPENTMAAFRLAADYGYSHIELDPAATKDGVIVILHDNTVTRTARKSTVPPPLPVVDPADYPARIDRLTYDEVAQFDFGAYFSDKYIGEKIPRFDEVLEFAKKRKITLKLDAKIWRLSQENIETIFASVQNSKAPVGITCATVQQAERAVARLVRPEIHYDGAVTEDVLRRLSALPIGELYVWLPYKSIVSESDGANKVVTETAALVKQYARLGIWTIDKEEQLDAAVCAYADIIETNGRLKPRPIAIKPVP